MIGLRAIVGGQLREAIRSAGRTQADVAASAGVTPKHLSQMLAGNSGTFEVFDRIAAEVGVAYVLVCWPRHEVPS